MSARFVEVALATGNKGKLAEFNAKLSMLGIKMHVGPKLASPPEDGLSYFANAAIKARYGAKGWNVPCVGEDSGIEVVGLNDLPGPFSSRFCKFSREEILKGIERRSLAGFPGIEVEAGSVDKENNKLILDLLRDKRGDDRICRYVACVVLAEPSGKILYVNEASVWGRILEVPKGVNGFGFDPIVEFFDFPGRSVAEVSMEEKGLVSHRGQAIQNLVMWLGGQYA